MALNENLLYSFRRCPYAMRARMALVSAQIPVTIHEVSLKDKPDHMLEISPKGTVPVLQTSDGNVLEESIDIIFWVLGQNDPDGLLNFDLNDVKTLIAENDGPFKAALDRYKYPSRYPDEDCSGARDIGEAFLIKLNDRIDGQGQIMGSQITIADIAIFPFIRQFANTDRVWFDALPLKPLQDWLSGHINGALFTHIMRKYRDERYDLLDNAPNA
ncbi:MAG: glutathione S-transferase [Pseudomonadota bacterium]